MKNKGFTLVELAIVLVIIGLLVGGVLQGQELIKQAQIRNTVQQLTSYDAAVNTFRAKYREMPGDITRANAFGVDIPKGGSAANVAATADAQQDGDGDGTLEDVAAAYEDWNGEMANFWVHLSNVNLVKGEYSNDDTTLVTSMIDAYPEASVGVGIAALTSGGILHWISGVGATLSTIDGAEGAAGSIAGNGLTPEEAYGIDSKIDDGKPDNGVIQVITTYSAVTAGTLDDDDTNDGATHCINSDEYNLALEGRACTLRIRAST